MSDRIFDILTLPVRVVCAFLIIVVLAAKKPVYNKKNDWGWRPPD